MKKKKAESENDPHALLTRLRGMVSDRQLRLCACACARLCWEQYSPLAQQTIEAAERYCDDPAAYESMIFMGTQLAVTLPFLQDDYDEDEAPGTVIDRIARATAYPDAWRAVITVAALSDYFTRKKKTEMKVALCSLIREVGGNPLAPPRFDPVWVLWNDGTIPKLARAIHAEQAFERMPILGDALEEAGCQDLTILDHCRADNVRHVRGCWVLEAILNAADSSSELESTLVLPIPAWLVTCRVRGRKPGEFPLGEDVRPRLLPVLAKTDPEFVVARSYDGMALKLQPMVRTVKEVWFLKSDDGITLKAEATGKVQDGLKGPVWFYTKREKALEDLAAVYQPVQLLMSLRTGNTKPLAIAALAGDRKALVLLVQMLAQTRDARAETLHALLPGMPPLEQDEASLAPVAKDPEAELAELRARATPCPRCGKPRLALRVRKEGPNQGRLFLKCSDRSCDSFEWASSASSARTVVDPYAEVLQQLRQRFRTCVACGTANPVVARATRPGPNQGRFFLRCSDCEKFDWISTEDGDFVDPDWE